MIYAIVKPIKGVRPSHWNRESGGHNIGEGVGKMDWLVGKIMDWLVGKIIPFRSSITPGRNRSENFRGLETSWSWEASDLIPIEMKDEDFEKYWDAELGVKKNDLPSNLEKVISEGDFGCRRESVSKLVSAIMEEFKKQK